MELVNKTYLQVKIDEKTYSLECYADSQLGAVHDALSQMKVYIVERINAQADAEGAKKAGIPIPDPVPEQAQEPKQE